MKKQEFNALVQRYTEEIQYELSKGIINYNKDGKIKKEERRVRTGAPFSFKLKARMVLASTTTYLV